VLRLLPREEQVFDDDRKGPVRKDEGDVRPSRRVCSWAVPNADADAYVDTDRDCYAHRNPDAYADHSCDGDADRDSHAPTRDSALKPVADHVIARLG